MYTQAAGMKAMYVCVRGGGVCQEHHIDDDDVLPTSRSVAREASTSDADSCRQSLHVLLWPCAVEPGMLGRAATKRQHAYGPLPANSPRAHQ